MEEKFQIVLNEYIKNVEEICNILVRSINYSENLNLKNKYDFFEYRSKCKKMEFEAEGITYRLHGVGCMAFCDEKMLADWDFGYRSRWCGIEPWKVALTLKENKSPYMEYYDGNLVKTLCEQLVEKGIMFKKYNQYYFEMMADETFKPEFPTVYDTLIIESDGSTWTVPRNKIIDRFIRKSTRVHNQINKHTDKYMLKFLLDEQEIYTIPYNDVSYPESAVKIMSDVIIKNICRL